MKKTDDRWREFESALAPLASKLRTQADTLLDLREAALARRHPGLCVACYFKLLAPAQRRAPEAVTPLRTWLERHLEVVAQDEARRPLERLPVRLEAEDLESYCFGVMRTIQQDRAYPARDVALSFSFKQAAA